MIVAPSFRRASLLAVALLPVACFNVSDVPPLGTSTGPGTTDGTTGDSTGEPTPSDSTGSASDSTGPQDPSTSGVDSSTTAAAEESSSGDLPEPVCGDGVRDPATETCDDGNRESGDLCDASCQVEERVFSFAGRSQTFDVPDWVDALEVEAWGAQGGGGVCSDGAGQDDGGRGGYVSGILTTIGGVTLTINVGGQGVPEGLGGFNGGGTGGQYGAGGGGATDVRLGAAMLPNRLLVAAGGGGGNCGAPDHGDGGDGGGLMGAAGISLQGLTPAGGGTQAAGGSAGDYCTPGSLGLGGTYDGEGQSYHVAGGGGGYYGGGGAFAAGGGGGSSYLGVLSNGATMPGVREGDGEVRFIPVAR